MARKRWQPRHLNCKHGVIDVFGNDLIVSLEVMVTDVQKRSWLEPEEGGWDVKLTSHRCHPREKSTVNNGSEPSALISKKLSQGLSTVTLCLGKVMIRVTGKLKGMVIAVGVIGVGQAMDR